MSHVGESSIRSWVGYVDILMSLGNCSMLVDAMM